MITDDALVELLLSGRASTAEQAEALYLDEHLEDVVRLVESDLSDEEFRRHWLIQMLFAHGSRGWEDALR